MLMAQRYQNPNNPNIAPNLASAVPGTRPVPPYAPPGLPNAAQAGGTPNPSHSVAANAKVALQQLSSITAPGGGTVSNVKAATGKTKSISPASRPSVGSTAQPGIAFDTPKQVQLLSQCDYRDKTMWAAKLLLGGNSVNGFLRATATVQRIKKQRARQNNSTKQSRAAAAAKAAALSGGDPAAAAAGTGKIARGAAAQFDQSEEEKLKKEIMNPRTAKKLKTEMEQGLVFCASVHNVIRSVLFDLDPSLASSLPHALIIKEPEKPKKFTFLVPSDPVAAAALSAQQERQAKNKASGGMDPSAKARASFKANASGIPAINPSKLEAQHQQVPQQEKEATNTTSPGGAESSTLRKLRKRKPVFTGVPVDLPEVDANGKRTCSKKEYHYRVFQLLRYRELKEGDFCAARLSSRDLWILAKVLKDYTLSPTSPPHNLRPVEFLQLSDAKRDSLFREKVLLRDVEERDDAGSTPVTRNLVLPLPRDFGEASEWGTRLKKGSRIYAMYPQTTSLYPATVIDSTTYCRGDDDIIVVEFDGEEVEPSTGQVPTYHIPARFVTLIPHEFPASQLAKGGTSTQAGKRKSVTASGNSSSKKRSSAGGGYLDMISMDFDAAEGGAALGFDALDLDFDKPLADQDKQDEFPPF
jgi:hypothetical protein